MAGGIVLERLEALMKARGYGPGELAYHSEVSYNYIYKIRKGRAPNIAAAQVEKLARALKTNPGYLLGSSSNPGPSETDYEIIEGRAELRPEIEELAARLEELPDSLRERFTEIVGDLLDLIDGGSADDDQEAERSDPRSQFAWLWQHFSEAERAEMMAQLLAEQRAANDAANS